MGRGGDKIGATGKSLLYGPRKASERLAPASIAERAPRLDPFEQLLADYDKLERLNLYPGNGRLNPYLIVASSPLLYAPSSPTHKEYRGHIALKRNPGSGEVEWVGLCAYGPGGNCGQQVQFYYKGGPSLDAAIAAVNKKLGEKTNPTGSKDQYVVKAAVAGPVLFTRRELSAVFREHPRKG